MSGTAAIAHICMWSRNKGSGPRVRACVGPILARNISAIAPLGHGPTAQGPKGP